VEKLMLFDEILK